MKKSKGKINAKFGIMVTSEGQMERTGEVVSSQRK